MKQLEVYVSYPTIAAATDMTDDTIEAEEGNIDFALFNTMQNEFGDEYEVKATSGSFDSIEVYDEHGDPLDPAPLAIRITETIARALKTL